MKEKKRISKIYNSKIFWAIISLILSLIIWSYISSVDGSIMEKTFSGIEVQFEGESVLLSQKNLVITNVDTGSVSVRVRGNRTTVGKISASEIKAVIDVSKITQPNDMALTYELVFPDYISKSDITIISRSPDTIKFTVEKYEKINIPVKGSFEGTIADGCVADELVFEPEYIVAEGPENILSTIDHAWVSFGSGEMIDASHTADVSYTLMDKNGNAVPTESLTLSTDTVSVTQPILKTKELPLTVNIIPGGGVTAEDCKITIEPNSISVAADSRLIDDKSSLVLCSIDLSSFENTYEQTVTIDLGEGIENLSGVSEAVIKIDIPGVKLRTLKAANISCKNCSEGYTAIINSESVDVTLRSKDEEALDAIKPEDITIVVDLADYGSTTGQIRANGTVKVLGSDNVGAVGEIKVVLTIIKD